MCFPFRRIPVFDTARSSLLLSSLVVFLVGNLGEMAHAQQEAAPAPPADTEQRLRALEEEMRALRAVKAQTPPAGLATRYPRPYLTSFPPLAPGPFTIQSPDGRSWLKVGGLVQSHIYAFVGNGRTGNSAFSVRRVRLFLAGTAAGWVDYRIMPEFGEGRTSLQDAYLDLRFRPEISLRAGKFKPPYSLERLQMAADVPFVERSIANNLVPIRDVGFQLVGTPVGSGVEWELGLFNGAPDNTSVDGNADGYGEIAARIFAQPFVSKPTSPLRGLGFGIAATTGRNREPLNGIALRTAGRSVFFRFTDGVTADGSRTRLAPQFYFYKGSLGLLGEHFTTRQRVRREAATTGVTLTGFNLQATYVLTGEHTSFRNVVPRREFDPLGRGRGAVEATLRFSRFNADKEAFQRGVADAAVSADKADAYTVGLNWYLNRQVKAQLNYERTTFGRPLRFATGLHKNEDTVLTQLQFGF